MSHDSVFDRLAAPEAPSGPNLGSIHLLRSGWRIFRARPWLLLGSMLFLALAVGAYFGVMFTMFGGAAAFAPQRPSDLPRFSPALFALNLVLNITVNYLFLGFAMMLLRIRRGQGRAADLFCAFRRFFPVLFTGMLLSLIVIAGFLLLVIPGFILAFGLYFAIPIAVESRLGPIRSIRASWRLTRGYKGRLFLFLLANIGVDILAVLIQVVPVALIRPLGTASWTFLLPMLLLTIPAAAVSQIVLLGGWMSAYDELLGRDLSHLPPVPAPEAAIPAGA